MNEAIKAAMTAKKIDLLLSPEAVLARENNVDITDAVVTELNRLLPSVSITPPAGYQPVQLVQQKTKAAENAARTQHGAAAAPDAGTQPQTPQAHGGRGNGHGVAGGAGPPAHPAPT